MVVQFVTIDCQSVEPELAVDLSQSEGEHLDY